MNPRTGLPTNINWLPALAFLGFGAVFVYASLGVPETFGGSRENRNVPLASSLIVLALSALELFGRTAVRQGPASDADESGIVLREFLLLAGPLLILIGLYGFFQIWFGYVLATAACGFFAFRLFGNSRTAAALHAAIGTAVLYFLFFRVLKLYDAPGSVLDASRLF